MSALAVLWFMAALAVVHDAALAVVFS